MNRKSKRKKFNSDLQDHELNNSGVAKILLQENQTLKNEVSSLKKSLKVSQNELESLRSRYHVLDKDNSLLGYRLKNAFLPEFLKFTAGIGAGFAANFFFNKQNTIGTLTLVVSLVVYAGVLHLQRK